MNRKYDNGKHDKTKCEPEQVIPVNKEIPCSWPECHRIFFSLENLAKHLKVHNEGLHECIYCKKLLQTKSDLNRHIRIHTGEKPFACSLCGKSFSRFETLKSHTRTHTGEKPYTCSLCLKSFSRNDVLQVHKRSHTREKPYNCNICTKSFTKSNHLVVHQRIHNGDKPYNCNICRKSFAQSHHLVVHERIHNGHKPYKCTFCSESFSQLGNLTSHVRMHTGERPFNCKICSKSFAQQSGLYFHMRKHADKVPRARSIGGKSNSSSQHIRRGEKIEEENKPNNRKPQPKHMNKDDAGRPNKRVSTGGASISRMQTSYEKNEQISPLTCQVCHQVIPSIEHLCRHYSLQHNLPKVVICKAFDYASGKDPFDITKQ